MSGVKVLAEDFSTALETLQDAQSQAIGAPKVQFDYNSTYFIGSHLLFYRNSQTCLPFSCACNTCGHSTPFLASTSEM